MKTLDHQRQRKDRVLNLRVSERDYEMLVALMDETGMSGSEVIRQAVRAEHRRVLTNEPAKE